MLPKSGDDFQHSAIETSSPSTDQKQEDDTARLFESKSPVISFDNKNVEGIQTYEVSDTGRNYSMHLVVSSYRCVVSFNSNYYFRTVALSEHRLGEQLLFLCRRDELFGWKKASKNLNLDKSLCSDDTHCTEPWINDPRIKHIPTSIMWSVHISTTLRQQIP